MTTFRANADAIRQPDCAIDSCGQPNACQDCRPEEWRDIAYQEDWVKLGVTSPNDAIEWDMDPMEAQQWIEAGCSSFEAHQFEDLGVGIEDAAWWWEHEFDGEMLWNACFVATRGLEMRSTVARLRSWVEAGFDLENDHTILCVKAGVGPDEATSFEQETLQLMAGLRRV